MSIFQGFTTYNDAFGIRGVLALSFHRLLGRPKEFGVKPAGFKYPLSIRLRTTDVLVYKEIFSGGQYAFDLPFHPKTIVDIGANTGMTSVYYTHKYPDSRIIAMEPEVSNFEMLTRNTAPYPNIFPVQGALWSRDGEIGISEPDPATGAYGKWGFVTQEGSGARVPALTLPTLMANKKIDSIDLLKIDIEGPEKEVFGGSDWMKHVRCLVIELHDRFKPGCTAAVETATRGFSKLKRGEMTVYLSPETNIPQW